MMDLNELQTPCLLLDLQTVKDNCQKMRKRFNDIGVNLRPHMKTHKTLEIGNLQTDGTKKSIVVSTLKEAEFYCNGGFEDILYGSHLAPNKMKRLKNLANSLEVFHVFIDNMYGLELLDEHALSEGKVWSIYIVIDNGYGRDGCVWSNEVYILQLAKFIQNNNSMTLHGLYTHEGNSYSAADSTGITRVSDDASDKICHLQKLLLENGVSCATTGIGSTPSCSHPGSKVSQCTEVHPGCYVFYDAQHMHMGACTEDDVAIRVMTRIIGHKRSMNRILIDCGFLGVSHDGKGMLPHNSFAIIENNIHLSLVKITQEVGTIEANNHTEIDFDKYPIGSILFIIPYHACATAAMHSDYYVKMPSGEMEKWQPCRGW